MARVEGRTARPDRSSALRIGQKHRNGKNDVTAIGFIANCPTCQNILSKAAIAVVGKQMGLIVEFDETAKEDRLRATVMGEDVKVKIVLPANQ